MKEGYVPQDEIQTYESKGKQWTNSKPSLPPGAYEEEKPLTKNQKKNERRKQKRKDAKQDDVGEGSKVEEVTNKLQSTQITTSGPDDLKIKRIKNLTKKLRQIDELQSKIDSGEIQQPEATQLEKLSKRSEIEKELEELQT